MMRRPSDELARVTLGASWPSVKQLAEAWKILAASATSDDAR